MQWMFDAPDEGLDESFISYFNGFLFHLVEDAQFKQEFYKHDFVSYLIVNLLPRCEDEELERTAARLVMLVCDHEGMKTQLTAHIPALIEQCAREEASVGDSDIVAGHQLVALVVLACTQENDAAAKASRVAVLGNCTGAFLKYLDLFNVDALFEGYLADHHSA
jgi:hypothetical protein